MQIETREKLQKIVIPAPFLVIPAKAGIQIQNSWIWIPDQVGDDNSWTVWRRLNQARDDMQSVCCTGAKRDSQGVTLIEILLSISLIAIVSSLGLAIAHVYQTRNDLDLTATGIAQTLRRAHALTKAIDGDSQWGVKIQSGTLTLFKGTSYATRSASSDEIYTIPSTIVPSGTTEFVFARFTGESSATGTVTITGINNDQRNITLHEKGRVEY